MCIHRKTLNAYGEGENIFNTAQHDMSLWFFFGGNLSPHKIK